MTPTASSWPPLRSAHGCLVAVTGASGGLGASAVTAALAVRAVATGRTAVAVDLDPLGGGLDVVLGLEQTPGTRWDDLAELDGEADGRAVLATLPRAEGVRVLSHGRWGQVVAPSVVGALLRALVGVCDLVVLDLPRSERLPEQAPEPDRRLVLAGTDVSRVAALSALLAVGVDGAGTPVATADGGTGVLLRVRAASEAAGMVSVLQRQLGAPVWGVVPDDRHVAADLVHGIPPGRRSGPLVTALDPLLAALLAHRAPGAA